MKSTGDPILDLQAACKLKPMSEDELRAVYGVFGWGPPFEEVLKWATGTYIDKGEDNLYRARNGSIQDVLNKVLEDTKEK